MLDPDLRPDAGVPAELQQQCARIEHKLRILRALESKRMQMSQRLCGIQRESEVAQARIHAAALHGNHPDMFSGAETFLVAGADVRQFREILDQCARDEERIMYVVEQLRKVKRELTSQMLNHYDRVGLDRIGDSEGATSREKDG